MKSIFKKSFIAASLTVAFVSSSVFAEGEDAASKLDLKDVGYAMGASLAAYVDSTLKQQQDFGTDIKKEDLVKGLQDALDGKSKMTEEDANKLLAEFSTELQQKATEKAAKEAQETIEKGTAYRDTFAAESNVVKSDTGLLYLIESEGEGTAPTATDTVSVHYRGMLIDGTEFDSSYSRNEPATFRLDQVIPGWTEGLQKIKPGGKIKLVIPPELGYGDQGMATIPANSTLVFEVELLSVNPAPEATQTPTE
ncbi:FKBP-type peptidyl-prolyl cis-trans isomerase [Thorsellia anophelis]|uniref:Peptidyl-prolyl cis-trans isomerase n=1 Tax=Thorsellia anophelis DSM 18579 TaxID=1123402 RepID=A0A1I0DD06_9GAMM|nr:FKBP-type peptidyl-prolyl cis-trans isomerase [Thorsellia anophelis]SET30215.1 FKBP-type peptidyl-prolyl cis-trans isomerase FkpA [Thorsellia anophelis DSM 18579]